MKHVLVLNQFALPRTEGGGTRHIDLFGRLVDWQPLIVAGDRNHYSQRRFRTTDMRFRLVRVPRQHGGAVARFLGWVVYAVQAFGVAVGRRKIDLVYGSSPQPLAALAGLLAARIRSVPFVLEIRDLWPESMVAAAKVRAGGLVHRAFGRLERVLVRSADRIVCVTAGWEPHLMQLGAASGRISVISNGAELADFQTLLSRRQLRAMHHVDGFTAIFAGAHGEKDGIDLILDAARDLPNINFLLVGSGPAKPTAVSRVQEQELVNVSFRQPVPKSQLTELLRACDVGIHAVAPLSVFDHGMSPNKLFDYLASELPIVSNAIGPLRRILTDGECGRLGGPYSLTECLHSVWSAPAEDRSAWSRRGKEIVQQKFSRAAAGQQLERLLDAAGQDERSPADD